MRSPSSPPAPAAIRRLLALVAVASSSLDALCLDHFPQVFRLFTGGMDRQARENLLLQSVSPQELLAVLWRVAPEVLSKHAALLTGLPDHLPTPLKEIPY